MNTDLRSLLRFGLGSTVAVAVIWGFIQMLSPAEAVAPNAPEARTAWAAGVMLAPLATPVLWRVVSP